MSDTVFFDIGDTLASPVLAGAPPRLVGLQVYPYVKPVLDQLAADGVALGLISNIGPVTTENVDAITAALTAAGLAPFFPDPLRIYGRKDSTAIFLDAARRAGHQDAPDRCLFTGEDSLERSLARDAGMRVCPHPLLVAAVLRGETLRYVRVTVPEESAGSDWRAQLLALGVVPAYVSGTGGLEVYAVVSSLVAAQLDDLGFAVDRLGAEGDPLSTELFLFRDDLQVSSGFMSAGGNSARLFGGSASRQVLVSNRDGLIVAVPGAEPVDSYHFAQTQHGHTVKLMLDASLLAATDSFARFDSGAAPAALTGELLRPQEIAILRQIDGALVRSLVDRYTGGAPLDSAAAAPIQSRHIWHADNQRAVEALARQLEEIGEGSFQVRQVQFTHQGRTLRNVEAELAGASSPELVVVSAHLDSTAKSDENGYDPRVDPAPGADDDASGVAAVLAAAIAIRTIARDHPPKRGVRFVLFNAEEDGLVGSKAYARAQALQQAPIVAVFQMDMVGFRGAGPVPSSFEVHVGFPPSPAVVDRSLPLSELMRKLAPELSPTLTPPQVYVGDDPAAGRSDHASFHERGYAACACSEDFFVGPRPNSPAPQPNPNYHRSTDRVAEEGFDVDYAASIARLVAGAALAAANA